MLWLHSYTCETSFLWCLKNKNSEVKICLTNILALQFSEDSPDANPQDIIIIIIIESVQNKKSLYTVRLLNFNTTFNIIIRTLLNNPWPLRVPEQIKNTMYGSELTTLMSNHFRF